MFDIGFSELVVIGIVALVVIGPERLPKVARTAGLLFGRLQRYVTTVKADISREMELSELNQVKTEFQDAARGVQESINQQQRAIEAEVQSLSHDLDKPAAEAKAALSGSAEPAVAKPTPAVEAHPQLDLGLDSHLPGSSAKS
jgi:sec-independent protein translocase protein TatB